MFNGYFGFHKPVTMKYLLPLSFIAMLTVSCTRYQYLTVKSSSAEVHKKSENQFVAENDSLLFLYDFKGKNLPLNIMISNKSDQPVLVDWRRSKAVINDESYDIVPEEEVVQQIAPKSYIRRELVKVARGYMDRLPHAEFSKRVIQLQSGTRVRVQEASFPEVLSPVRFSTHLSILPGGEGERNADPVKVEHVFYVSEILRSGQKWNMNGRAYVEKATGFGNTVGLVAAAVVLGAVVAGATAIALDGVEEGIWDENYYENN